MPIGSIAGGLIGQAGSQAGGDMAWGGAQQGAQMAQQGREIAADQTRKNRALSSPWTGTGESALGQITKLLGLGTLTQEGNDQGIHWVKGFANPDEARREANNAFVTSPGYQFRVGEGIKARDRAAGARGMRLSGAQAKAIDTFGQQAGSEEYGNYFNQLAAMAGMGQGAMQANMGANSTLAGVGANAMVQGGDMLRRGAEARGSSYAAGSAQLASGIGKGIQNAFTLYDYFK